MLRSMIQEVHLLPSLAETKRQRDYRYLMELTEDHLLFSFYTEAGLNGRLNYKLKDVHWGWDGPLSQIRGTFTGHWLSAAARIYSETGDSRLKVKADYIVSEIARCQQANGDGWAFPIPEKFLHGLKKGQHFWAPQYVCHKVMMGLLDMYLYAGNKQALEILRGCADWFYRFTDTISREVMSDMMDLEETGGIMELWGDLYAVTGDPRHLELARRYERPRLTQPLLEGVDVLTNMHANMTIPEIQGCARAYEVTGEERFRRIVEKYWEQAVEERGCFATGGQTNGEIWTPKQQFAARLGDMNQEHCTVYNMIRLADYLYRWTGDPRYAEYIESNIWNGLFAQGFCEGHAREQCLEPNPPEERLITYYLPLAAGSQKKWGSKTEDFWCCHCTLVQANARYREWIYYGEDNGITVAQYFPSTVSFSMDGKEVSVTQEEKDLCGDILQIRDLPRQIPGRPNYKAVQFAVKASSPCSFSLKLRIPRWIRSAPSFTINGEKVSSRMENGYAVFDRVWNQDTVEAVFPKDVVCVPLPDQPDTVAFLDGPVVLAGLVGEERILFGDPKDAYSMLAPHDERWWSDWNPTYKTVNQQFGFYFKPLYEVTNETYTVYFPVRHP
jgi:DUF1680 family protein